MHIDIIEDKIARNEMNAAQVFTQSSICKVEMKLLMRLYSQ